jgi:hypothetical protein
VTDHRFGLRQGISPRISSRPMAILVPGTSIYGARICTFFLASWNTAGQCCGPRLLKLHCITNYVGRIILVDSTRAGKRIPDALSKTVSIWCAVLNRASFRASPQLASSEWDTSLYTPPGVVSIQEHAQIESRLDQWAESLVASAVQSVTVYRSQ